MSTRCPKNSQRSLVERKRVQYKRSDHEIALAWPPLRGSDTQSDVMRTSYRRLTSLCLLSTF